MRGDDRVDIILHEKGPQRSLIRNKPTETLTNGSGIVKQQYRMFIAVIHKQNGICGSKVCAAQEAETQLLAAYSVEWKPGREEK